MTVDARSYRFAPRDTTGVVLGLSVGQCVALGSGLLIAGLLLRLGAPVGAVAVPLVAAGGAAVAQIDGQPLTTLAGPWLNARTRNRRWLRPLERSEGPWPPQLGPIDVRDDHGVAVVTGRGTKAVTFSVAGDPIGLLDPGDQDLLASRWASAMAALATDRSSVRSVTLTVRAGRTATGQSDDAVANRVEAAVTIATTGDSAVVDGVVEGCRADGLEVGDPWSVEAWRATVADWLSPPPAGRASSPAAIEDRWGCVRVDGGWHRVFWVAEWPRVPVSAAWFAAVPSPAGVAVTWTVVCEPVPPAVSRRRAQRDATRLASDEAHRARAGFRISAAFDRTQAEVEAREADLVDGHAEIDLTGLVVVTAASVDELDRASDDTVQAASRSGIVLQTLYGRQARALRALVPGAAVLAERRRW